MGQLYAMECDICGERQVEKKPFDIKGKTYMENGQQKFACFPCDARMKAAFELKKDGLEDPLSKVAGLIEQRDQATRERDEARATLSGDFQGVAQELAGRSPFSRISLPGPQPGKPLPVIGMNRPGEERPRHLTRPELPDLTSKDKDRDKDKPSNDTKDGKKKKWKG